MMLKKMILTICLVIICFTASSFAGPTVTINDSYGDFGGEFVSTPSGLGVQALSLGESQGFETFCLEKNEYFFPGTQYDISLSKAARGGGIGGQDIDLDGNSATFEADSLDPRTAYLYHSFITKSLDGYDYGTGSGRIESANALQHVIWYIEDEEDISWVDGDNSLADKFYSDAGQAVGNTWNGTGNVYVVNMSKNGNNNQDQLIAVVPAPGAVLLGGIGTAFVGWMRRRKTLLN